MLRIYITYIYIIFTLLIFEYSPLLTPANFLGASLWHRW